MALRSLVAKLRNPVAAALRLPPSAPRADARPFFGSAKGEEPYRLKINIHSASEEELLDEALRVRERIDEVWELVGKEREKLMMLWKDMESHAKLLYGSCILSMVIRYASDHSYEDESEDDPAAESGE